jgi:cation diffusion facilitator CzcD-associated flavoprotein CzcO
MEIVGRDGTNLRDLWGARPLAHRGVSVPGFPNFFVLYGPNTNLGSNSILFMLESQINYVRQLVRAASSMGWDSSEVTDEAYEDWRQLIDGASGETAWLQGCQSWYTRDGVNTNNWPFSSWRYHSLMRNVELENFHSLA